MIDIFRSTSVPRVASPNRSAAYYAGVRARPGAELAGIGATISSFFGNRIDAANQQADDTALAIAQQQGLQWAYEYQRGIKDLPTDGTIEDVAQRIQQVNQVHGEWPGAWEGAIGRISEGMPKSGRAREKMKLWATQLGMSLFSKTMNEADQKNAELQYKWTAMSVANLLEQGQIVTARSLVERQAPHLTAAQVNAFGDMIDKVQGSFVWNNTLKMVQDIAAEQGVDAAEAWAHDPETHRALGLDESQSGKLMTYTSAMARYQDRRRKQIDEQNKYRAYQSVGAKFDTGQAIPPDWEEDVLLSDYEKGEFNRWYRNETQFNPPESEPAVAVEQYANVFTTIAEDKSKTDAAKVLRDLRYGPLVGKAEGRSLSPDDFTTLMMFLNSDAIPRDLADTMAKGIDYIKNKVREPETRLATTEQLIVWMDRNSDPEKGQYPDLEALYNKAKELAIPKAEQATRSKVITGPGVPWALHESPLYPGIMEFWNDLTDEERSQLYQIYVRDKSVTLDDLRKALGKE